MTSGNEAMRWRAGSGQRPNRPGRRLALLAAVASGAASLTVGGIAGSSAATIVRPAHPASQLAKHLGKPGKVTLLRKVVVSKLPAPQKSTPTSEPTEARPVRRGVRTTGVVRLVQTKPALAVPTAGPHANPAITEPVSITGLQMTGNFPPDAQVAEGGSWVVEMANTGMDVYTGAFYNLVDSVDLGALFFGRPGAGSDPKVVYDPRSHVFFASYLDPGPPGGPSAVDLAVSSDPAATWYVYGISVQPRLQDQPKLGFSDDKVVMSWNDWNGRFLGPEQYVVIQKAGLVAGAHTVPDDFWAPNPDRMNVIPAVQLTQGNTAYAIFHNTNTSTVGVMAFTGVPGHSPVTFTQTDLGIAHTTAPPSAAQPASGPLNPPLNTGNDWLESAVWASGNLWAAGNDACRYATDTAVRSCLRIIHIFTGQTMQLIRDVDLTMVGGDVMYPAIMLDTQSSRANVWIAFSSSSAHQYASSEVAKLNGGTIGTSVATVIYRTGVGQISYRSCNTDAKQWYRFGDYSGAAVNVGPAGIWAATEWGSPVAGDPCNWSTQVAEFRP